MRLETRPTLTRMNPGRPALPAMTGHPGRPALPAILVKPCHGLWRVVSLSGGRCGA